MSRGLFTFLRLAFDVLSGLGRIEVLPAMRAATTLCLATTVAVTLPARAHAPGSPDAAWTWHADPLVSVPLLAVGTLYAAGVARLWRRADIGRGLPVWRALGFAGGISVLVLALLSPLDGAAEASFALHMTQHMLLMALAAPLLVLGGPGVALLAALPARVRSPVGRAFASGVLGRLRARLFALPAATALHGVTIWAWHAPTFYEAALAHPLVHWLEHLTMLGTAVIFWWAVANAGRTQPLGHGAAVVALFVTMVHTGLLGILILLAPGPLYASHAHGVPFGLAPVEDQQIAGMVMLAPGGLVYLAAGLVLLAAWLAAAGRRRSVAGARETLV